MNNMGQSVFLYHYDKSLVPCSLSSSALHVCMESEIERSREAFNAVVLGKLLWEALFLFWRMMLQPAASVSAPEITVHDTPREQKL